MGPNLSHIRNSYFLKIHKSHSSEKNCGMLREEILIEMNTMATNYRLQCAAVLSGTRIPMFWNNLLPPSTRQKNDFRDTAAGSTEKSVFMYQTSLRYIPED